MKDRFHNFRRRLSMPNLELLSCNCKRFFRPYPMVDEFFIFSDTLKSNNDSKNRHFSILEKWLEDAQTIHKNYKRKLDEALNTIDEVCPD